MFEYKQVIVVRTDLNMSIGKLAGQVAHASISVIINNLDKKEIINKWFNAGKEQKKIILKIGSEEKLKNLMKKAEDSGLIYFPIYDAGLTELEPNTLTCIGFFPMKNEEIDPLTKKLTLL